VTCVVGDGVSGCTLSRAIRVKANKHAVDAFRTQTKEMSHITTEGGWKERLDSRRPRTNETTVDEQGRKARKTGAEGGRGRRKHVHAQAGDGIGSCPSREGNAPAKKQRATSVEGNGRRN